MKKVLSLLMVMVMVVASCFALTGCGNEAVSEDLQVGFIFLHDENSTYDKNFIDAALAAKDALGLSDEQVMIQKLTQKSLTTTTMHLLQFTKAVS